MASDLVRLRVGVAMRRWRSERSIIIKIKYAIFVFAAAAVVFLYLNWRLLGWLATFESSFLPSNPNEDGNGSFWNDVRRNVRLVCVCNNINITTILIHN